MEEFGHRSGMTDVTPRPRRERVLNAPWPPLALVGVIIGAYALQSAILPTDEAAARFGVSAADLAQGRWGGVLTSLFVHGGWTHALLNALAALAFGAPVARMTGTGPRGGVAFFAFYLLCGALSSLAFAAVAPQVAIGASGAVSGLMGAASRISPADPRGRLLPLTAPGVVGMAAGWLAVNLVIAVTGVSVGPSIGPVAWQGHIAGYVAGVLLAPLARRLGQGGAPGAG